MKQNLKGILFYAVFIIATVGIILFVMNSMEGESLVTSDLVEMVRNGKIVEYERDTYNDTMTVLTEKGEKIKFTAIDENTFRDIIMPAFKQAEEEGKRNISDIKFNNKYHPADCRDRRICLCQKTNQRKGRCQGLWKSQSQIGQ